jgi:hypothetical protein
MIGSDSDKARQVRHAGTDVVRSDDMADAPDPISGRTQDRRVYGDLIFDQFQHDLSRRASGPREKRRRATDRARRSRNGSALAILGPPRRASSRAPRDPANGAGVGHELADEGNLHDGSSFGRPFIASMVLLATFAAPLPCRIVSGPFLVNAGESAAKAQRKVD